MSAATDKRQAEAIERLRHTYGVKAGSVIYTTVLHVSRSGMTRTIKATVQHKGAVLDISHLVAPAIGARWDRDRGGVVMEGCGMDMTFAMVYSLSRAMWPKGHKCNGIDKGNHRCPSNDHSNDWGQAQRLAMDEIRAESGNPDLYADDIDITVLREKQAEVTEKYGLTYRKGRHHADGGYVLTRSHL